MSLLKPKIISYIVSLFGLRSSPTEVNQAICLFSPEVGDHLKKSLFIEHS